MVITIREKGKIIEVIDQITVRGLEHLDENTRQEMVLQIVDSALYKLTTVKTSLRIALGKPKEEFKEWQVEQREAPKQSRLDLDVKVVKPKKNGKFCTYKRF